MSHFIESAMKIIDAMDNFQRRKLNTLKASSLAAAETTSSIANNYVRRGVDLSQPKEKEDIIATYLKWIDLWEKYLDEQALNWPGEQNLKKILEIWWSWMGFWLINSLYFNV